MGCGGSKLDDLPAVELCRNRTQHLSAAIHFRYALADAHRDYANSLRAIGAALQAFLDASASLPPVLNLPALRKGDPMPPLTPSPPPQHRHSHSHSGSHIQFQSSDDDSDDDGDDSDGSPLHHHLLPEHDPVGPTASTTTTIHYARNRPAASSVSYEQRPQSPEPVYHYSGDPSSSSSPPPPPYSYYPNNQNNYNSTYYPNSYPSYDGFLGSNMPPPNPIMASPPRAAVGSSPPSKLKSPPPMPSPPRNSTWDFLNLFDYNNYYQRAAYTPSRSSKEVREEEGIPDLEDEDQGEEVVKEAYAASSPTVAAKDEKDEDAGEHLQHKRQSVQTRKPADYDADVVVDKNVVAVDVGRPMEQRSVAVRNYRDASEVALEIKVQFERASDTAGELSKVLEVGKLPYRHSSAVFPATKMICMLPPATSKDLDFVEFEEDKVAGGGSLSLSLQKLYIWECKLYEEILAEEKIRVHHERQCKRLKNLDEKGAEAYKIDATQAMIKKLSTKIRIAIQVVDSISKKINKLRDDELWPRLVELIRGFVKMWRVMLECHQTQCHAISGAKSLDSISAGSKLSAYHMDVAMKLELEVIRWIGCFSSWTYAQKSFIKSLNEWLSHCLNKEDEVTADGVAPFSPGRVGAPAVFVICNHWSQIVDRISEREVIEAMQAFAANVRHIWDQSNTELRQKMMVNKEMESAMKIREREALTMQRAVDALNKKLVQVSGQNNVPVIHQSDSHQTSSLQLGLKHVFEAIENFTSNTVKAYEDLYARVEEEMAASDDSKVSEATN